MFFLLRKFVNQEEERRLRAKRKRIKRLKLGLLFVCFVILTVVTQVGGIVLLLAYFTYRIFFRDYNRWSLPLIFTVYYTIVSVFVIPQVAPFFGRMQVEDNEAVKAHSFFYKISNRNYVTIDYHETIQSIATDFHAKYPGIQLVYTDANFPFIDGFPLLPHRYHTDGKKIDFDFIYENEEAQLSNLKPTFSGYGFFESPFEGEKNQINFCLNTGYKQYEFTKYVTLGILHPYLTFSEEANKYLIELMDAHDGVETIFIEPHLHERLGIESDKIIYHGCGTVRHDDHIHLESI